VAEQQRTLARLDQPPPAGLRTEPRRCWPVRFATCTSSISGVFCAQKIVLSGHKSWCESTDPEFVAKAAEIVGL